MSENIIIGYQILSKAIAEILKYLGSILFLLMLIAPFEFYAIKIIILIILVSVSIANILTKKKIRLVKPIIKWFITFIGFGIFFSLLAFLIPNNNEEYILRSMPVNVIWPTLFCIIIPYINTESVIRVLNKTMVLGTFIISLYLLCAALSYLGYLPIAPSFFSAAKPIIGKYDASIQLFLPSTTSLFFLIPFLVSYFLLQNFKKDKIKPVYIITTLVLSIAATIVTARRALILNLLISPALILIFLKLSKVRLLKADKIKILKLFIGFLVIVLVGCAILIKYEILNLNPLITLFKDGFDFSKSSQDVGSIARADQSVGLIHSWRDYPILGSGLGSASEYVNRSEATPWVYELSYLTLLFQSGIIGLLIYFGLLFWIFYKGIMLIRLNTEFSFIIPSLVGCFCFLLANASNPYLIAFDHMWTIFLPLGLINFCYYKKKAII